MKQQRKGVDVEVQVALKKTNEEIVGEQFLMLANKLVLGGCNINKYINITNYS
jgi:hypothetical protein